MSRQKNPEVTTKITLCQENVEVYSVSTGIALRDLGVFSVGSGANENMITNYLCEVCSRKLGWEIKRHFA